MIFVSTLSMSQFCVGFHGIVTEYFSGDPIKGVQLTSTNSKGDVEGSFTTRSGFYAFELDSGEVYNIEARKDKMVSKKLIIDTRHAVCPDSLFYNMDLQITMFGKIDGFDFSIFNIPIGVCQYNPKIQNMSWNNDYTNKMSSMISKTMQEYEKTFMGYYTRSKKLPTIPFEAIVDTIRKISGGIDSLIITDIKKAEYNESNDILEIEHLQGLFFTVQVGVYSKSTDLYKIYNILNLNSEFIEEGKIRYTSGQFRSVKLANEYRKQLIKFGVEDAFVIAYYNGERISIKEANDLIDKSEIGILFR